ncbi:hypothetical protein ACJ72_00416 [Emergomyces africanus]|uniref:Uncharacterized protein n=1 Tax=Emergomyces africanus TaxID=1955775 RepID=A0A1B7P8F3_9EURO|nr:hypothetical protein ACJ72_00416 [Emergomyces africanus]
MSFHAARYNALRSVEDVTEQLKANREILEELAHLLVANGLHRHYDIRLLHKHFEINDDERVVTFDGDNCKVSTPYNSEGVLSPQVMKEHGIERPVGNGVVFASDFLIDEGGAIPYEFAYGPHVPPEVPLDQNFLLSWNSILRTHNMGGTLGLAVQDGVEVGGFEESDSDARWSKITYEKDAILPGDANGYLTTSWRIDDHGSGLVELKQCSYCSSLRRHGKSSACT